MHEIDIGFTPPKDLESLLSGKEARLPDSILSYIRRLKSTGHWDEAMRVRSEAVKKSKSNQEKIRERLGIAIQKIIMTDDPQVQSENEIRAVWLLNASGLLDSKKRTDEIEGILSSLDSKSPALKEYIEKRLPEIRDEIIPLMPKP